MRNRKMLIMYIKIEIIRFLREPISLFFTLIFPIVLIYIFGNSFGSDVNSMGETYYNSLVSIDIAFLIANFTLMGIGNDLANQKELGITMNMKLLPIKKGEMTFIQSVAYLIILFISMIFITCYVYYAYKNICFKGNILLYLLFVILSYFVFVSFTKFIVTFNFSARTIQLICSSVFFILLFVSGIVIPKESLPETLQGLVNFSPLYIIYYVLNGIWNLTISIYEFLKYVLYFIVLTIIFNLMTYRKIIKKNV